MGASRVRRDIARGSAPEVISRGAVARGRVAEADIFAVN